MIVFKIIGIIATCLFFIYIFYTNYCDIDHDVIAGQGAKECPKCKEKFDDEF